MTRFRSILPLAATLAIALPAAARGQDPVRTDPPMGGANPPGMEELKIASGASRMNAFIYLAGGAGARTGTGIAAAGAVGRSCGTAVDPPPPPPQAARQHASKMTALGFFIGLSLRLTPAW